MAIGKRKQKLQELKGASMFAEISISYKVTPNTLPKVARPEEVYDFLKEVWDKKLLNLQEQCVAVFLNNYNRIIGYRLISTGTMKMCTVNVKLIVSLALHCLCEGVIISHNHPSGNLTPSNHDTTVTMKLKEALSLIDVKLLDHLIISETYFLSLEQEGLI